MLPRLLRTKTAHVYLGMNRKTFDKLVRPHVSYIPVGKTGVAFDRLDLDQWVNDHKHVSGGSVSETGDTLWDKPKHRAYENAMVNGTLTKEYTDAEFAKVLKQATARKLKNT